MVSVGRAVTERIPKEEGDETEMVRVAPPDLFKSQQVSIH